MHNIKLFFKNRNLIAITIKDSQLNNFYYLLNNEQYNELVKKYANLDIKEQLFLVNFEINYVSEKSIFQNKIRLISLILTINDKHFTHNINENNKEEYISLYKHDLSKLLKKLNIQYNDPIISSKLEFDTVLHS